MGRLVSYFLIFFVNRFQVCFVQFFTIIIIKCKALFSCHSSSRFCSHLISFHFFFLKNKIIHNFTCDLQFSFPIVELKMQTGMQKNITKNFQANGSLRENVSVF